MKWAGYVARKRDEKKVYKVLVGKPEENRPLRRPRRKWEDWIKLDLGEIGWDVVDWIQLAQNRDRWLAVVSVVMNLQVLTPWRYLVITERTKNNRSSFVYITPICHLNLCS
jgi:hypothetical protein